MRAQVTLETLITLTAMAAAVLAITGAYSKVWDIVSAGLSEKRLNYAVALIEDAAQGCSGSGYEVHLPFRVGYVCTSDGVTLSIGGEKKKVSGVRCGPGVSEGNASSFSVLNCILRPVT